MTNPLQFPLQTALAHTTTAQALPANQTVGGIRMFFSSSSGSGPNRVVRGERRRRAEPPESGRERAEAPRRESGGQGMPPPGFGGGGGTPRPVSGGSPGLPLGGPKSIMGLILTLIVVCVFAALQFFSGDDAGDLAANQPPLPAETRDPFEILPLEETAPTPLKAPTRTPASAAQPTDASALADGSQRWLVMLYQDADDKILEQDIYIDLNEAEKVGSSDRLTIVAQFDRYHAGFQGDGDWTSARRFLVKQDDDLNRVRSEVVADLGEVNMSDAATLVDFVEWAVANYPADRYALILSDHGMGWPGGWSDTDSARQVRSSIPLVSALGDQLYLNELDEALGEIRQRTGLDKLDLIGMDACLMAQVEVFSALAPHARVAVASEEVEPAVGWAYTSFLSQLGANPDLSPAELSRLVVDSYIKEDQRIIDTQARSEMLRGMGGMFGLFNEPSPQMLISQMGQDSTLTAVDLDAILPLVEELNRFAYTLQNTSQPQVARARAYAQSFTSIFGAKIPPSYIDLGHFASLLRQESNDQAVKQGAGQLLAAIDQAVIAEEHGPKRPGATGIAIYFPNSQVYKSAEAGPRSYTAIADRFATASLWDDFMAFHYAGRVFEPQDTAAVIPAAGSVLRAPGAGQITLSQITTDSQTAAPERPALLSADVRGGNLGYIYLFAGFIDRAAQSIFIMDMDYIESADTREVSGVYYPDWGEGDFTLEFDWEPVVFAIDDGSKRVTALFKPQSYGETFEEAVYSVDGVYIFGDSGEQRNARLLFSNGALRRVVGFTGEAETGAPREIIPSPGDQFIILERWLDLDSSGRVINASEQQGETLTFGSQTFRWVELDAAAGDYIVGFMVEDLDGNTYEAFTSIVVQ